MGKGGDLTVKEKFLDPVQAVNNEQGVLLPIQQPVIQGVNPVGNETEDNYVIPVNELQNAQPVEDEQDITVQINPIPIQPIQPTESEKRQKTIIPLNGKLITAEDPVLVGKNFRTLTNMRYGEASPRSISGATKINSSVINGTYLKTRNAFQFRKIQPDLIESHILAQAYNTGITGSKVYENTTAPPAAGDFTATEVWSDDADSDYGFFSDAPDGNVVYCNGVETCIWGGSESRCVKFLNFDPAGTFMYDYTDAVTNTKTDTQNLATFASTGNGVDSDVTVMLHLDNNANNVATGTSGVGGNDAYTTLLLHCDGSDENQTFTDSSIGGLGAKTVTAEGDAQIDTAQKKFGTGSGLFDGNDYLSIPASVDFQFGTNAFTIDFWVRFNALPVSPYMMAFFAQYDDIHNSVTGWMDNASGTYTIYMNVLSGGVYKNTSYEWTGVVVDTWYHLAFIRGWGGATSTDAGWAITIDGTEPAGQADVGNPAASSGLLTGNFTIGRYATFSELCLNGWIDEFRVSKGIARWTTNFTPEAAEYDEGVSFSNTDVTFSNSVYVFGYSGVFNGTSAYLSATDSDDFDLSGGIWTYDLRARCTNFTANNPLYYQKTDLTKISFINGAHEPVVGEPINGNTSSATGIVDSVVLDSGDWGGTAVGTIYMHTVTGTWQSAENIKDPSANVIALSDSTASDAGDNYISIFVDTDGKVNVLIHECYGAGSDVVDITCGTALVAATWYHIEIGENGSNWYIFIDGQLKSITTDSSRAKNYIGDLQIGYDNTNFFVGYLDEIRLSKAKLRHSTDFTIPAAAYTTATTTANVYIGSLRPLKGVKFYTYTENTSTAAATGFYWNGATWAELTLTDGTALSGATLGQPGSITFSSTVSSAKNKYIEGVPLYYYWFVFSGIDAATSVYYVTMDAPFQDIVDFWDGEDRLCAAFYKYTTTYTDYTVNITEDSYDTAYADTYADLASLGAYSAGNNCVIIGFFEQVMAINFSVPSDRTNSTAATVAAVDYWDGSDWTSVGVISDGMSEGGISIAKSGTISFNAPNSWLVFKRTIANTSIPLFYYRVRWDQALDATTGIYHVSGIPAQKQIKGYKFPIYSQDRLMLCGNKNDAQNTVLISAYETAQVFNGTDSMEISFGNSDALNCGCTLFAMYGSILYNITVLFKDSEMWGLVYSDNAWRKYRIAETIGCPAPMTLATCIIPPAEGEAQANRSFAIWMSADGVYTSDGRHPVCVSWDIRDLFNQNSSSHINQSYVESFSGFIDKNLMEYHLLVALTTGTVTTLDAEYVLDLRKWKWYKVDRTSGVRLQCGISVIDSYGNNHSYGFIDSGYMERLEYGTTFDSQAIVSTLQTGDFPLIDKDFLVETSLRGHVLIMAAKTYETMTLDVAPGGAGWSVGETVTGVSSGKTCKIAAKASGTSYTVYERSGAYTLGEVLTNGTATADQGASYPTFTTSVTATHYVDSSTTGTDYTVAANNVTKRLSFPVNTANSTPGIFHSIKYVVTSSYETVGFEPLVIGLYYHPMREYDYE